MSDIIDVSVIDTRVLDIVRAIGRLDARAIVVGGYVRDHFLGLAAKDIDVEVFGLDLDGLENVLSQFGDVIGFGKAFGVLQVKGLPVDFALPRRDSKIAAGHKGFAMCFDAQLSFVDAARRRDLTINSMGLDPLTGELLDPHHGLADLRAKILRATDAALFADDPLRGLRVAQFAARFEMRADLSELPGERLCEEFRKLLLKGRKPSIGLDFLRETQLLRFFPELDALPELPQDPEWHPEGDVWVHTLMVVDAAAMLRDHCDDPEALMFAALCHDLGKAVTTVHDDDGHIRSPAHDSLGVPISHSFLKRLHAPNELLDKVGLLVHYHLAPTMLIKAQASDKAYRRLARKLGEANLSMEILEKVARADHFGRLHDDAKTGAYSEGEQFLTRVRALSIEDEAPRDVVLGRHLIAHGLQPGPHFAGILAQCRSLQDETGWLDAERILQTVLARHETRTTQ
jgi:tRNA nucleotidyltransferase (CCA-adding enzyme)